VNDFTVMVLALCERSGESLSSEVFVSAMTLDRNSPFCFYEAMAEEGVAKVARARLRARIDAE
jgi:hypothetical protein